MSKDILKASILILMLGVHKVIILAFSLSVKTEYELTNLFHGALNQNLLFGQSIKI